MLRNKLAVTLAVTLAFALISTGTLSAQSVSAEADAPPADQIAQNTSSQCPVPCVPPASGVGSSGPIGGSTNPNQQPTRILGIIPNFRAVSANTTLPPLSGKGKFWLATKSSFDYSSVITVGIEAGWSQARNSEKEFGQGAAGFGRRYWHHYADATISNYFTQAILPTMFGQDPRYYTLGHGNISHRTGYAVSRIFVTKSDAGNWTANFYSVPGNLLAASISNAYYPASHRGWTDTYQRWAVQLGADAVGNVLKEFWPDIASKLPGNKNNNTQQCPNNPCSKNP
jgi:hypothetical protein